MKDQADALRRHLGAKEGKPPAKVITITSGKGGVGKSNFSLNFALALIQLGKKVVILDADLGLANIDVLMGISPKGNLFQMIEQGLSIWDILERGPGGVELIASQSGFTRLLSLDEQALSNLMNQLHRLDGYADFILIDTGAGLTKEALYFILSSDEVILITTPEPTSLTDAYAVIKMIHLKDPFILPNLVVNRVHSSQEGRSTGERLSMVVQKFLHMELPLLGFIHEDAHVGWGVRRQEPFILLYPEAKASEDLRALARSYLSLPLPKIEKEGRGMKGFLQRMLNFIK
ncbi:MinD/ParA family protein [Thermicanus aegyptius]|uniref:MinD/ParA family protein n=1 Tax=Thermicanus aegyptius TaxID=94009 RepID=UPI000411BC94|nr:MinD/ParA family protein [Thermicanus aegyptius]